MHYYIVIKGMFKTHNKTSSDNQFCSGTLTSAYNSGPIQDMATLGQTNGLKSDGTDYQF